MLDQKTLECLRREGVDAHGAGTPRSANPYSYEASNAWDSGWMQAEQAGVELVTTWQGECATGTRDCFGGIVILHDDGTTAYVQPGDDANDLADTLDQCETLDNIDGLLCDRLEWL